MHIHECMDRSLPTCTPQDSLDTATVLLTESDLGAVAVVDPRGRLVGLVTPGDVSRTAARLERPLTAIPVARAMRRGVVSCYMAESVDTARRLMDDERVVRLPIVDDDLRPIGTLAASA